MPLTDPASLIDPVLFATQQLQLTLDPWQAALLRSPRAIVNCSRQSGKSFTAALGIAHHLLANSRAEILVLSASEIHAGEVILQAADLLRSLGIQPRRVPGRSYDFAVNRSRVRALPCRERAGRGPSATLVIVDEAALVADSVYYALTGTLATTWTRAAHWILSTPRARHGFFYDIFTSSDPAWTRLRVPASACPRITPEFLAHQQAALPAWAFSQDYLCEFGHSAHAVFRDEDIMAAYDPSIPVLSPAALPVFSLAPPPRFYIGLDLAQLRDHAALVVLEYREVPLGGVDPYTRAPLTTPRLAVRWIDQLPNGTLYPDLILHLRQLLATPEFQGRAQLIPDATAGGGVFLDHLRAARLGAPIVPVTITGGSGPGTQHGDRYNVPKQHLIAQLEAVLRHRRLRLATACPHLATLRQELTDFQRLITPAGHETYSGKATSHDDTVLALALAVWQALRQHKHDLYQLQ